MRHALPWRRAPTIHHAAVAPPLAAPVSGEEEGAGVGWGLGGGRRGSTIKLAGLHPEAPPAPRRRRRLLRSAARARDGAPAGQG